MTNIGIIHTGSVQYDADEASVDIDDFIESLERAREDGITHVCLESGNYRGAKYMTVYADDIEPVEGE
jgi:2-iminoacetate synthase ThiH